MKVKSTVAEIRARFDSDVERFSNLETGQKATIDAPLAMELITAAAAACNPNAKAVLDIGCGAGNNTLKLLDRLQSQGRSIKEIEWSLLDLSRPMLERAEQRVCAAGGTQLQIIQIDLREANLPAGHFDIILAAAVLHHLRDDTDWETAFQKIFRLLAPGGSFWVTDFVAHEGNAVQHMMWNRYGDYLTQTGGAEYRDKVFAYVEQEDSPRPVTYQTSLMQRVGFVEIDILHKNSCFAAFGGRKP
ncbi:MAG TPA: class I SAM-dependent methyltransferase [Pseudomonadales bacterium]|nr:class I SAM-dependent methyltransferase [Pseudomonadales bacterium]